MLQFHRSMYFCKNTASTLMFRELLFCDVFESTSSHLIRYHTKGTWDSEKTDSCISSASLCNAVNKRRLNTRLGGKFELDGYR